MPTSQAEGEWSFFSQDDLSDVPTGSISTQVSQVACTAGRVAMLVPRRALLSLDFLLP